MPPCCLSLIFISFRDRERERERETHTHTHTHTQRGGGRERGSERENENAPTEGEQLDSAARESNALFFDELDLVHRVPLHRYAIYVFNPLLTFQ